MVLPTGTANLASVLAGFARAGASPGSPEDAAWCADAERVVLPGVGAFGARMAGLRASRPRGRDRERARGRPAAAGDVPRTSDAL